MRLRRATKPWLSPSLSHHHVPNVTSAFFDAWASGSAGGWAWWHCAHSTGWAPLASRPCRQNPFRRAARPPTSRNERRGKNSQQQLYGRSRVQRCFVKLICVSFRLPKRQPVTQHRQTVTKLLVTARAQPEPAQSLIRAASCRTAGRLRNFHSVAHIARIVPMRASRHTSVAGGGTGQRARVSAFAAACALLLLLLSAPASAAAPARTRSEYSAIGCCCCWDRQGVWARVMSRCGRLPSHIVRSGVCVRAFATLRVAFTLLLDGHAHIAFLLTSTPPKQQRPFRWPPLPL